MGEWVRDRVGGEGCLCAHLVGEVVVDDDVDALDVDAAPKQVRGHQDALVELLRACGMCRGGMGGWGVSGGVRLVCLEVSDAAVAGAISSPIQSKPDRPDPTRPGQTRPGRARPGARHGQARRPPPPPPCPCTHLEGLEARDAFLLLEPGVDDDRGEVALLQDAVELHCAVHLGHENHHLRGGRRGGGRGGRDGTGRDGGGELRRG